MSCIDWDGPSRQPCPDCDRGPKDRSCGVTVEHDGSGVAHCFRCGFVETRRDDGAHRRPGTRQERAAAPSRYEVLSDFGRELWAACRPVSGDALAYPPSVVVGPALVAHSEELYR